MNPTQAIRTLSELKDRARQAIEGADDRASLESARVEFLGKKGELTVLLKGLAGVDPGERPRLGKVINETKEEIESLLGDKERSFEEQELSERLRKEQVDVSLPGRLYFRGRLHPISRAYYEIIDIFRTLGFQVVTGPEAEWDLYNFEALNFPKDHPARDMQDTFFLTDDVLLRTHTSPVQIRSMLKAKAPPVRIISPGRVFRRDSADASHSPMFFQVEGLYIDRSVSMANLKSDLTFFVRKFFERPDLQIRFRPSYFPFTEPSVEVDIGCLICSGGGCSACKQSGFMEILGAGMVNPKVFEAVGYSKNPLRGYAFGTGIDRMAMLKYGVPDIRMFTENDLRFLEQF